MSRRSALRGLAVAAALALWLPALGLVELVTPWFRDEQTFMHDVCYGVVTGLLVPLGLLAQLRSPGKAVAGLQQVGAGVVAYALAGALADPAYLVLAALLAAALTALLLLHPIGGTFLAVPDDVSPLLAGLALLPAVPFALYALGAAEKQRDGAPPVADHVGLGSWAALTAMGFGIALVAALAALRTTGWRVPLWSAAAAAAAWGLACVFRPDAPGSEGRIWGLLALVWALAFALAGRREARATAPTE